MIQRIERTDRPLVIRPARYYLRPSEPGRTQKCTDRPLAENRLSITPGLCPARNH